MATLVDVERPAGPAQTDVRPRVDPPTYVYRGLGDEHLRGQSCHWVGAADDERVVVVMSCGCEITAPWWTLEPISP